MEHEQQGEAWAAYGKRELQGLAEQLTGEFGSVFDGTNLRSMRRTYLAFPIRETVSLEFSWSHYHTLLKVDNASARQWYIREAVEKRWSVDLDERRTVESPRESHRLIAANST